METKGKSHILIMKNSKNKEQYVTTLIRHKNVVSQEQVKRYVMTHSKTKRELKNNDDREMEDNHIDWDTLSKQHNQQDMIQGYQEYITKISTLQNECGIPFFEYNSLPTDDLELFRHMVFYEIHEWVPFQELAELGSSFSFYITDFHEIEVYIAIGSKDCIPQKGLDWDSQGQMISYDYSLQTYYSLLKKYVYGITIRVAREIFSFLPFDKITVSVVDNLEEIEQENIWLYTQFTKEIFSQTNFDNIICEEFIHKFICIEHYEEEKGFIPIQKITKKNEPWFI